MEIAAKNKILASVIGVCAVSLYFFPFEFTFLPRGLNTKMMLAVAGVILFGWQCLQDGRIPVNRGILGAILIACIFSGVGFIAVDYNHTDDYTYALYILSFATWLGGAYAVYRILKLFYNKVSFRVLINYLVLVCVIQCFLALAIEWIPQLKFFVNLYTSTENTIAGADFFDRVNRLYGIGAALDVAGTRFSIVLIGLTALIIENIQKKKQYVAYLTAFFIISIIGNIMSRTTTVGCILSIIYLIYSTGIFKFNNIKISSLNFWITIFIVAGIMAVITAYFYNTDQQVHGLLRYGFEGFFNWIEKGKWYTDSTNKLNNTMWVWPTDTKTWIIGSGIFYIIHGQWTDIGYCRFVLYSLILGLVIFSFFFVYNAIVCRYKFPSYKLFFYILLSLSFIIWMKVPTDLFIIYALLYCIDREEEGVIG